jgi:hypothetical protein
VNARSTHLFAVVLGSIGDPDGTRRITAIVALLVVLGVGLAMVAVWLFKTTRPDPELLAPLDVMGQRKWRRADPVWQRRRLDQVRPEGAHPLSPSVAPPELDEAFDLGPAASGFDDLHDDHQQLGHGDEHGDDAVDETKGIGQADVDTAERPTDVGDDGDGDVDIGGDDASADGDQAGVAVADQVDEAPETGDRDGDGGPVTPTGIVRPTLDDLPEHELDPQLLEMAMRDLDAEMAARREQRDADGHP